MGLDFDTITAKPLRLSHLTGPRVRAEPTEASSKGRRDKAGNQKRLTLAHRHEGTLEDGGPDREKAP